VRWKVGANWCAHQRANDVGIALHQCIVATAQTPDGAAEISLRATFRYRALQLLAFPCEFPVSFPALRSDLSVLDGIRAFISARFCRRQVAETSGDFQEEKR